VRDLLERAAGRGRLVVCLDDMHWADPASIELLTYLLEQPVEVNLGLLLCHRPRQAPAELVKALTEAPRAVSVAVSGLSADEAASLLGPGHGDAYARAAGNPLYLLALASGMDGETADMGWVRRLSGDLCAVDTDARTVARAAAVIGEPVRADLLAAVAAISQPLVVTALDELADHDLLRSDDSGRLVFRHPLVERAVYLDAGASWRQAAHGRAAAALGRVAAPPSARAHHLRLSAGKTDASAALVLEAAADDRIWHEPAVALDWYAAALDVLPSSDDDARRRMACAKARALCLKGRLGEARALIQDVLASPGSSVVRRRAVVLAAMTDRLLGQPAQAAALLQRQLDDQLRPSTGPVAGTSGHGLPSAEVLVELSAASLVRGDWESAVTCARDAVACVSLQDRPLHAASAAILALAQGLSGRCAMACRAIDEAAFLLDGLTDEELVSRLDAAVWLGEAEVSVSRYSAAARHHRRGLALARDRGLYPVLTQLLIGQARVHAGLGQLSSALRCAEGARSASLLCGSPYLLTMTELLMCRTYAWLGDSEAARRTAGRAADTVEEPGGESTLLVEAILAEERFLAGDALGFQEQVLAAAGGSDLRLVDPTTRPRWFRLLTRAAAALDDSVAAKSWAERAADSAGTADAPLAFALLAQAEHLKVTGSATEAALAAHEAHDRLDRSGNVLDAAEARLLAGQAHAAAGERMLALDALTAAEASFEACGAESLRAQAARELRRLGRRVPVHRHGRDPVDSTLTVREKEVAQLVAAGRTNREIGGELYLSEKTVERHVSHLFLKLHVSNRAGVAATVTRA
jgi:DNA-binding CsgD family transcriptional regulator/tetratricopeptide (TPR) repeat protein